MLTRLILLVILLRFGESQLTNGRKASPPPETELQECTLSNSSLNHILENSKCMTKDEVKAIIQAEIEPVLKSVQTLTNLVGKIPNNTARLIESNPTEQSPITTRTSPATGLHTCNGTPGWKQVLHIDMTNVSHNCPLGLNFETIGGKRLCGRANSNAGTCSSTTLSVGGSTYSQVCGRIRGYQAGATAAFYGYRSQTIDDYYVDGVSLTHGPAGGRTHIWTYATGYTDLDDNAHPREQCPCAVSRTQITTPPFIGNDYFCESGAHIAWTGWWGRFFPDNPLWDGQGCTSTSRCCQFNNPPWFTKTLPTSTSNNIELRLCAHWSGTSQHAALEQIELYVK